MVERIRRASKGKKDGGGVGYGNPPKQTRFKPGQSGNPKGRPKGSRNFATEVREKLKSTINVNKNGRTTKISAQLAGLEVLFAKAFGGDPRAIDQFVRLAEKYSPQIAGELDDALSPDDQAILDAYIHRLRQ